MSYDVALFAKLSFPARKRQLWEAASANELLAGGKWPKPLAPPHPELFGERSVAEALAWLASGETSLFFVSEFVSSKIHWRGVLEAGQVAEFGAGIFALMRGAGKFGGFGDGGLVTLEHGPDPWGLEAVLSGDGFGLKRVEVARVKLWWRLPQVMQAQEDAVAAEKRKAPTGGLSKTLGKAALKDFDQALREVSEVDEALLRKVTAKDHYEVLTSRGGQRTLAKLFPKRAALLEALSKGSSLVFDQTELQLMTLELYGDLLRDAAYPLLRRWVSRARRYDAGLQSALRGLSFSSDPEDAKLILGSLKRFAPAKPKGTRMSAEDEYLFSAGAVSLGRLETPRLDRLILEELKPLAKLKQVSFAELAFAELLCLSLLTHKDVEVWPALGKLAGSAKSEDLARILGEYASKCQVAEAAEAYLPRAIKAGYAEHVAQAVLHLEHGHATFTEATAGFDEEQRTEWELVLCHSLSQRDDLEQLIATEPRWLALVERLAKLSPEITEGRAQLMAAKVLERLPSTKPRKRRR
ncbi:MAG: hypothetical protein H6718_11270 [Polyangiaceae bacterium]|nr:hypothetical protein [Polyangiaceae bacterium]